MSLKKRLKQYAAGNHDVIFPAGFEPVEEEQVAVQSDEEEQESSEPTE